ncbi:MAG TPA: GNAT family N-acetyltransferase [Jatrophihabitans sp.]|jgi:RimJ/RimL family protein N-acetyltransferase|nr:GNAT family N-acetyltransferase [Jatrophihabitans sp.]
MARVQILRTQRLVLTSWLPSDVDELLAVHSDPETMSFVRHGRPETRDETASLIDRYISEDAQAGYTKWRLTDLDDRLVGRAGFGRYGDGRELGYTIRRALWGNGLATEIAAALVTWHSVHAAGVPLYACVARENPASRRVLRKIGFETIGLVEHSGLPCELLRVGPAATTRQRWRYSSPAARKRRS